MSAADWRTAATTEALDFWRQHYSQASAQKPAGARPCPDAATAPHGCGLVRYQRQRDANGALLPAWHCTFCATEETR
jgi:hypothetical protein